MQLDPGASHPNAPCLPEAIAQRLGVTAAVLDRWCGDGLPATADGLLDPYAVVSWVSWNRLESCPGLARKWRAWLRWFTSTGRPCRITVRRGQEVYLPAARRLRWWVPEPPDAPGQRVIGRMWSEGEPCGRHRLLRREQPAERHRWQAEDDLELAAVEAAPSDRPWCEALVAELAAAFTYAYRRHGPGDGLRWDGTCLDLALQCGRALAERGRPWRLVSGVVAHRGLANVHFWVEFDDGPAGWIPLDPTIPAVARMLGGDWRAAVPWAVGRHDGRRIRVSDAEGELGGIPGGAQLWSCGGELDAEGDGALYCTDWAVGECSWSVSAA